MEERRPGKQGAEITGNSNGLTPETLNQRLRNIQDRLSLETIGSSIAFLLSLTTITLGAAIAQSTLQENPINNSSLIAFGVTFGTYGAISFGFVGISVFMGRHAIGSVDERRDIIRTAVERGFSVTGRVFKQIRQTPTA